MAVYSAEIQPRWPNTNLNTYGGGGGGGGGGRRGGG